MKKVLCFGVLAILLIGCQRNIYSSSQPSSDSSFSTSESSSSSSQTSSSSSISSSSSSTSSSSNGSSSSSTSSPNGSNDVTINDDAGDYYDSIDFTSSPTELKTSLSKLISKHTTLSYNSIWDCYEYTDLREDGTIWDMYSNVKYTFRNDQCGNYSSEGDCYNREHSIPQSWFGRSSPMVTDLVHLVPTDGYVNNRRGNYPFGEVSSPTYTSGNGSKLGNSSLSSYNGTVFEPIDEYKGDFARIYMYFVTCYQDKDLFEGQGPSTFRKVGSYATFTDYAKELFLSWNELDPISEKEINRNNGIERCQGNRNPFVDIPELAEMIFS